MEERRGEDGGRGGEVRMEERRGEDGGQVRGGWRAGEGR